MRVNWLERKEPFDFDGVEIVAASDEEVEEFVRQTKFDTDIPDQAVRAMRCEVNTQCHFKRTNTMKILEQTFGNFRKD